MEIPLIPYIVKSIAFSISLYFLVCNLINAELKPMQFIKYILAVSLPIIFLFFNYNILIFAVLKTLLIILTFKIVLKMNYKDIIIPTT
jgi:hypothetical protein